MAVDLAGYDELVHQIYDAAFQPTQWPEVVGRLTRACGGSRGLLFTPLHSPAQGGFVFPHNISQTMMERWAASGITDDPIAQAAVARGMAVEGNAIRGGDLVPLEALKRSRLYVELWEPMGIADVCSGIVFSGTEPRTLLTAISVYRHHEDFPFDADDLGLMRRLVAHLSRSLGVMFHLRDNELQGASNLVVLDRLAAGVVLVDGRGAVGFANAAAERLFRRADPIAMTLRGGGGSYLTLAARLLPLEQSFQLALGRALEPLSDELAGQHFSQALVLPDPLGKPSCALHVAPLGNAPAFAIGGTRPQAIVFLYDLEAAASVAPGTLCELFGLTGAEARAALQVLQGGSVTDMAQRLGVAANTFKSQIKAVYSKTHTNRQADLLKLLLALAAA